MLRSLSGDSKAGTDLGTTNIKEVVIETSSLSSKEHARILRKVDWHVMPLIVSLYIFSFLDRVNIGNAKVAGMQTDLNLIGLRYNIASAIFFVPYFFAQVPSNIVMKFVRPSLWLPGIMLVWGLIMTLMCFVKTYHGLLVARFFLGLAEGGMFPGVTLYLTSWYPRAERAKRIVLFLCGSILGGAFGGLLGYLIEKMEGIGGLHGWQWIFCLEGIATVLLSLIGTFLMYDSPETASFLTEAEGRYLIELLRADSLGLATHYHWRFVLQAFKDYKIHILFGIFVNISIPASGIALFTPIIISGLGYTAANAQLLSITPFAAACACALLVGIYSDRHQSRGPCVIAGSLVGLMGFILLYIETRPVPAYIGVILAAIGVFSAGPLTLTWVVSNAGGDVKRGAAIAIMSASGSLAGICSSFIFFDPPRFHFGLLVIMASLVQAILLSSIAMWNFNRLNKQKETMCREQGITDDRKDEFTETGDDSPLFRYML